jgi:hypothetical protein
MRPSTKIVHSTFVNLFKKAFLIKIATPPFLALISVEYIVYPSGRAASV